MAVADVEVPFADQLITISGESTENRVQNLTFSGITFAHTDYQLTDVDGSHEKTTCQAAQTYTAFADSNWHSEKYEMVDTLPGVINVTNADYVFPASCAAAGGTIIPIRKAGSEKTVWFAPDGTAVGAAAFSSQSGVEIENLEEGGQDVGYIEDGDWISFANVDLIGAEAIELRYATPYGGSSVEIRTEPELSAV